MISKNEIKYIQSLFQKKNRDTHGLFIAEAVKLVDELLNSDFHMQEIYATKEWIHAHPSTPGVTLIEPFELEKISALTTPNQVLAVVKKNIPLHEPLDKGQLTLVLDGIQDPGNLGTIIRIADWFGITQIVAGNDTVDLYNSKTVQSTMGSICRVQVWYKELSSWLANVKLPVYGAMLNGDDINKAKRLNEGYIVIGNESKGIRQNILPFIQYPLTIPAKGKAESLNAAVATGIILSHLVN